uniref:Uncharacterized protein n=1 Tax=Trichuris muris TaxID=70415 RepID=A0A5S6QMM4_TRIMR
MTFYPSTLDDASMPTSLYVESPLETASEENRLHALLAASARSGDGCLKLSAVTSSIRCFADKLLYAEKLLECFVASIGPTARSPLMFKLSCCRAFCSGSFTSAKVFFH